MLGWQLGCSQETGTRWPSRLATRARTLHPNASGPDSRQRRRQCSERRTWHSMAFSHRHSCRRREGHALATILITDTPVGAEKGTHWLQYSSQTLLYAQRGAPHAVYNTHHRHSCRRREGHHALATILITDTPVGAERGTRYLQYSSQTLL